MANKAIQERPDLYRFEEESYRNGFLTVCGVDEAGRGPLAGPVFAAAVVLPRGEPIQGVDDSKKLSAKKRGALFDVICDKAVCFHIASASEDEIDKYNILQATFLAMRRAVEGLKIPPDIVLVDGNQDPRLPCEHTLTIVHGDALSASIAAASILAKVSRDRYMKQLAVQYPQYGLEKHKGYATREHFERIRRYGVSPIHRRSFLKKWLQENKDGGGR